MLTLPPAAAKWLRPFEGAARKSTFARLGLLTLAAILTTGRRTVSNLIRTIPALMPGHPSTYHRVFSKRCWSSWKLARVLARLVVATWCAKGVVDLVGDDTVDEHPGRKVYGKDKHRDAVRSSKTYVAWRWGHKWIVLSILVKFPFARRRWALPVLVALYRSKGWNEKHRRRHKTPQQIMHGLVVAMLHILCERRFRFSGDAAYGTHEFAALAARHQKRLTLVSRFFANASLHRPAPAIGNSRKPGRRRLVGERIESPKDVVAKAKRRKHLTVSWYGGGKREVTIVSGTGIWYIRGKQPVAVLWILVHDCMGTHRDDYFFTTDVNMSAKDLIECYTGRWSIEVTFEEMRAYMGLETTRCRTENAVLREAPWLFGVFSLVCLMFASLPAGRRAKLTITWVGKSEVTFADAITGLRKWLWRNWVFVEIDELGEFAKLSRNLRDIVLNGLAHAA
jgi:hypothetical protein